MYMCSDQCCGCVSQLIRTAFCLLYTTVCQKRKFTDRCSKRKFTDRCSSLNELVFQALFDAFKMFVGVTNYGTRG